MTRFFKNRFTNCLLCRYSLALLPQPLAAQNPRGSFRGIVQDSSGARIPSASIAAQSHGTSLERTATSDAQGEFWLADLLPGTYRLTVEAQSFDRATADVIVTINSVREITVMLKPQPTHQSVTVQGQPSSITTQPVDTSSAVHQTVITSQDLDIIPLAARSFANIAYLAAGTEPLEPSDPTKARITAVSTGGSSGLNNDLSVDGADNTDDWIGGLGHQR